MKKTLFLIYCFLLMAACDTIFVHVSGKDIDLQGKWQMENVDTVYYNFQNSLFQYQIYRKKDVMSQAYGFYYLRGDTGLELRLLREYSPFSLDYLGWDTLYSETKQDTVIKAFKIERLTGSKLILSSDEGIISFRKF